MTLPLLLSVPHAGLVVPGEVKELCLLGKNDIFKDGDEGAAEIYLPLENQVAALVTTDIARAIIDMNRAEDDRRKDGVVKTHTCWDVPIYSEPLSHELAETLLARYYRPYHQELDCLAENVIAGIDCHTMAAFGPPVGPDPGMERPVVCLSNGDGTCPDTWLASLAETMAENLKAPVAMNTPFAGGYIIRHHAAKIPWIQMELSRAPLLSNSEKRQLILGSLKTWLKRLQC
jgi:N-formylglutamate amidohydrolase